MTTTPEVPARFKTPYLESDALKKKLAGITVTASTYPQGRPVPVGYVNPDFELKSASYPGIYLSYAGMNKASDREHRGPVNLQYAPPGYDTDVLVPKSTGDPDSTETEPWSETLSRHTSPYRLPETPIPYNLDFNITVVTRNYSQMFEIISQLDELDYLPARFGGLEVPEDGTVRTLELLGGPDTSALRDEDGDRLLQSVYSVRVTAEISLYDLKTINWISNIDLSIATSL